MKVQVLLIAVAVASLPGSAPAQTSPFVPETLYRHLVNEISGDRAFEHVRRLTHYHRTSGSRDFFAAMEWIQSSAQSAGLEDVRLIRQAWDGHGWSCVSGEAWLLDAEEEIKIADYHEVAVSIADHSRSTHVSAELIDVGVGTQEKDYAGQDVKDKIVLASGKLSAVMREAVWKRGALGILSHLTHRHENLDFPDQVAWGRMPYESKDAEGVEDGRPSTFAVMISPRRARRLQKRITDAEQALRLKVDIESEYPETSEQAMVEAWIRGREIHDQQIVLTAHVQEEMTSANDDASGCASLLEIGRVLGRLINQGKLPRPRRDIRFWWVNELSSQPRYFRDHPGSPRRMLLNINQDMVAARQSWGGRVQYASRLPWSLPHALDDVMESVLTMVRDGNTELLTMRGWDIPKPFPREITAVKGSREPFHARMVPYYDSTDHHSFTPARVGVPGTSLTNWPDEWVHSSGDDLENADATQLERNAVIVAAVAAYFATLEDADVPALAAYVSARARGRIGEHAATAVGLLSQAASAARPEAYRAARNLVEQATRKELAALASVDRLSAGEEMGALMAGESARLRAAGAAALESLEATYLALAGQPSRLDAHARQRELEARVFVPLADPAAFHEAIKHAKGPEDLHAMMRFETYNFADGHRSVWQVYEAVSAEALAAGGWYYGNVTPELVLEALEKAVAAGAFTEQGAGG